MSEIEIEASVIEQTREDMRVSRKKTPETVCGPTENFGDFVLFSTFSLGTFSQSHSFSSPVLSLSAILGTPRILLSLAFYSIFSLSPSVRAFLDRTL